MENKKSVIIVGAGISGLSAGVYLAQHGFDVTILERNANVGGLCTAWVREGRLLDGCIHWLTGTREGHFCYDIWKNIGAFDDCNLLPIESWGNFTYEGKVVRFLRDSKKAEQEWLEIAPEDAKHIKRFFKMVRDCATVDLPMHKPFNMLSLPELMKIGLSAIRHRSYLANMTIGTDEYASRFKNPAIRWALEHAQPGPGNLFSMIFSYATIVSNDCAIPEGGSRAFAERILKRFLSLGGKVKLCADVKEIIVEKNTAKGVLLKNGQEYRGDYVVTALDTAFVLEKLLNNKYKVPQFYKRAHNYKDYPTITSLLISYEIEDLGDVESPNTFLVEEPFDVAGRTIKYINIRAYDYDSKTFVKDNKTVCNTLIHQFDKDYLGWEKIYQDKAFYKQEKERIANTVLKEIVKKYPRLEGKIKLLDIATPITLKRYVNATRGAYMSYLFTDRRARFVYNGSVPGLKNITLSSQWNQAPGGLPFAAAEGKFSAIRICKMAKVKFNFKQG